ncbi:sugar phosphate nucleotidyltransferase [Halobacillus rhizosphaerae]|uniref:sugar phosphate nucleotidyltransferase n=1 Tax=Halobacillus rhizosphaerae TaxID=3064889 RepID=UPI00398B8D81
MKLVLLSGGSGKRLWPLSNDARSKQFLRVLKDEKGKEESMVQRVWRQLHKENLHQHSVIATSLAQVDMIKNQLGYEVPIVIEPQRRDTFPAIALAVVYLISVQNCDPNEVVCMLPVDPYVEDEFFNKVKEMEQVIESSDAELALMGVTPTYPSEKFGYIIPSHHQSSDFLEVDYFKEKPQKDQAEKLINKGALWNCGIFAFKLKHILDLLESMGLPTTYEELLSQYSNIPKTSFDYEVVERNKNIVVLPYKGIWKDLGTWNTLTDEMTSSITGKGIISEESENSHIINELDIPITLLGLNNVVVAASPDGILVTDKEKSAKLKQYLGGYEGRPMYEERLWGWYRVLEHTKYEEGNEVLTKRIGINSGANLSYQVHFKRSEVWTVIKGEGIFVLNNKFTHIRSGDVINIPLASKHSLKAITEMEIIEVQTGSELIEEDIHRFTKDWEEIMESCDVLI